MSSLYRRGSLVGLGLAFSACSSGSPGSQATGPKLEPWPSTGDYSACPDTSVKSPSTGCLCSEPYYGSTVCLPPCASDADCPVPPPGSSAPKCLMTTGGLTQFCILPCDADAGADVGCPQGYECGGSRAAIGPFCAVPGLSITDVSGRYDGTSPEPAQPGTPVGPTARLCGSMELAGELTTDDLRVHRSVRHATGCATSPESYFYYQDVYAIELVGPGPHRLVLDSCGKGGFALAVMIFAKSGSSTPYDTSNTCLNLLSSAEASGTKPCGLGVSARLEGFEPGIVYIVVTSNGPEIAGSYTLSLSSETSRC